MVDIYQEEIKPILMEIFPNTPEARIDYVIQLITEEQAGDNREYQLESMINLLSGSWAGNDVITLDDDEEEGAVGYANGVMRSDSQRYFDDLKKIFTDIDDNHLRLLVRRSNSKFDDLVDELGKAVFLFGSLLKHIRKL